MKRVVLVINFSLIIFITHAADSTLLKNRIQKIRSLSEWLTSQPNYQLNPRQTDTAKLWPIYDQAIKLFFDKKVQNDYRFNLKFSLYQLDWLMHISPLDSLNLRMPVAETDTLRGDGNYDNYFKNTVLIYFPMGDFELEGFYFCFEKGSSNLLYFIAAGGPKELYIEKKKFLNEMHSSRKIK